MKPVRLKGFALAAGAGMIGALGSLAGKLAASNHVQQTILHIAGITPSTVQMIGWLLLVMVGSYFVVSKQCVYLARSAT